MVPRVLSTVERPSYGWVCKDPALVELAVLQLSYLQINPSNSAWSRNWLRESVIGDPGNPRRFRRLPHPEAVGTRCIDTLG